MQPSSPPVRRVQRVRHETRRREVQVVGVEPVGAGFLGITFAGEALADFVSASFDDHLKFILADAGGEEVRRDYTPRSFDTGERRLTIEFALHGEGRASEWARRARVGDTAVVAGPRGSMIIPTDYDWHLLAGDATALPAIARRLEELPAGARAIVVAQVAPDDRRALASTADVDLQWVATAENLLEALRMLPLPAGEGFAWCAGEAAVMARVRGVLLEERGHPREAMRVAAYWRQGASAHHENLDA